MPKEFVNQFIINLINDELSYSKTCYMTTARARGDAKVMNLGIPNDQKQRIEITQEDSETLLRFGGIIISLKNEYERRRNAF